MNKDIMTLQEAMEYLEFKSENNFRKNCREGKIPCRNIAGEYRFSKTALSMWSAGMNLEEVYKKITEAQIEKALQVMG